jgi:serine phosphatase RsbU (regulator of sigma subunit)
VRNLSLAEEAAERRRLESELALARRIQVALLPQRLPEAPGWSLHGGNLPSRGVSGDFYEVVERTGAGGGAELVLVVADVSGKGMAASLLTASLEALLAPLIAEGERVDAICTFASRLLYQRTPPEKYATAILAAVDVASGRLAYTVAGHNPALLVRAGGAVEELGATGPPLGLLPEVVYAAGDVELAPGDTVLLYTDGLVEATDPDDEEYGLGRAADVCRRHPGAAPATLAAELEKDVERFARGVPFADDRTLLIVQRGLAE